MTIDTRALLTGYWEGNWAQRCYLDRETGAVVHVSEAVRAQLQKIYDDVGEDGAERRLISAELRQAHAVEMADERYLKIPEWQTAWQERDAFVQTVSAPLQRLLWRALDLQNSELFASTLQLEVTQSAAWQQFKQDRAVAYLRTWLAANDIAPTFLGDA